MPMYVPRSKHAVNLWPGAAPTPDGVVSKVEPFLIPYPVRGKPRGAVVVCPGGGYQGLAEHEGLPIAEWLNEAGLGAFVLRYRHSPHRHPVPLMDAQRAIRLVRARAKEWNVKPNRVGILGFSAGGHLTATAATHFAAGRAGAKDPVERQSCRPDAAILCYPVITFARGWNKGTRTNLLGRRPSKRLVPFALERASGDAAHAAGVPVAHRRRRHGPGGGQPDLRGGVEPEQSPVRVARLPARARTAWAWCRTIRSSASGRRSARSGSSGWASDRRTRKF